MLFNPSVVTVTADNNNDHVAAQAGQQQLHYDSMTQLNSVSWQSEPAAPLSATNSFTRTTH